MLFHRHTSSSESRELISLGCTTFKVIIRVHFNSYIVKSIPSRTTGPTLTQNGHELISLKLHSFQRNFCLFTIRVLSIESLHVPWCIDQMDTRTLIMWTIRMLRFFIYFSDQSLSSTVFYIHLKLFSTCDEICYGIIS